MTDVEMILAALAAGAAAGTTDTAKTAVIDAYTGLRDVLRARLADRRRADQMLDAVPAESGKWQSKLGAHLLESGAAHDDDILAAARALLALVDPTGVAAGKYHVEAIHAGQVHVGDTTLNVSNNTGAVGTFYAPVNFGGPPLPPTSPGAT